MSINLSMSFNFSLYKFFLFSTKSELQPDPMAWFTLYISDIIQIYLDIYITYHDVRVNHTSFVKNSS